MARKAPVTVPPPPGVDEEFENDPSASNEEDEFNPDEDREVAQFRDGNVPVGADWLAEQLGGRGTGGPGGNQKLSEELAGAPLVANTTEGAVQWMIERKNPFSGEADTLGYAALNITLPAFVKRFIDSMPKQNEDPVTFYFTPLDKLGSRMGTPGRPAAVQTISWDNVHLKEQREMILRNAPLPGAPGGPQDPNAKIMSMLDDRIKSLQEEQRAAATRAEAAEERARAAQEAAIKTKLDMAATQANDIALTYQRVGQVQQDLFQGVIKTREDAAKEERERRIDEMKAEREKREADLKEERVRREDALKEEREKRKAEMDEKVGAAKSENEARLLMIKAENDLRKAEIDARIREAEIKAQQEELRREKEREKEAARLELERQRIEKEAEKDRLRLEKETEREQHRRDEEKRVEAERRRDDLNREDQRRKDDQKRDDDRRNAEMERLRLDAIREDERRKEAVENRRLELERETNRQKDEIERRRLEQEREDNRRRDDQARRDKLDAEEQARQRTHQLSMEQMRTDALKAAQESLERARQQDKEYLTNNLALIRERNGEGGGNKNKLGIIGEILDATDMTPMDALEKVKGLLGGEGVGGLGSTIVGELGKTLREVIKRLPQGEEQGEEEEEEDEEEDTQEEPAPPPKKEPKKIEKKPDGPGLSAFIGGAPALPVSATPVVEATSTPVAITPVPAQPTAPPPPLAEIKAGRTATEALIDRLEGVEHAAWGATIMGGKDVDVFVRYVQKVGLDAALEGYGIDPEALATALKDLGLFDGDVPRVKESP